MKAIGAPWAASHGPVPISAPSAPSAREKFPRQSKLEKRSGSKQLFACLNLRSRRTVVVWNEEGAPAPGSLTFCSGKKGRQRHPTWPGDGAAGGLHPACAVAKAGAEK